MTVSSGTSAGTIRGFIPALAFLLLVAFFCGCETSAPSGITQVATMDALLAGVYDGHMSLKTLLGYGDFGIGTFEALDGEMVLLDGKFYQVRDDGKVYRPNLSIRTPFACVTNFAPNCMATVTKPTDMQALEQQINALVPLQNRFCAFLARGEFNYVRVRSVPPQKKPYPPLVDVTRNQRVITLSNVRGALVGFRCPAFVKGVNVPGYHLHFLADDLSGGGHVLEFELNDGILEVDAVHEWLNIYLPIDSQSFGAVDLTQDRAKELNSVEKELRPGMPATAGAAESR